MHSLLACSQTIGNSGFALLDITISNADSKARHTRTMNAHFSHTLTTQNHKFTIPKKALKLIFPQKYLLLFFCRDHLLVLIWCRKSDIFLEEQSDFLLLEDVNCDVKVQKILCRIFLCMS